MWYNLVYVLVAYSIQVHSLFVPLEDSLLLDKYNVRYVSRDYWQKKIANNATALSKGYIETFGDDLKCLVSHRMTEDSLASQIRTNRTHLNKLMKNNLAEGVKVIQEKLNNDNCVRCLYGFWGYQYCPGKNLVQFHGDPKDSNALVYNLGKSQVDYKDRDYQLLYNDNGYYISEFLEGGELCEVTGVPRVTELQYVCGTSLSNATFQWTKELRTCHYQAQIAVPALCELELFSMNDEKKMARPLVCVRNQSDSKSFIEGKRSDMIKRNEQIDSQSSNGVVDLLTKYDPIFLGYGFYLVKPKEFISIEKNVQRSMLIYTGPMMDFNDKSLLARTLYLKASKAISRMVTLKVLDFPDNQPFQEGDEFTWIADLVSLNGKFLSKLKVSVNSMLLVDIDVDASLNYPSSSNWVSYKRKNGQLVTLNSETDTNEKLVDENSVNDKISAIVANAVSQKPSEENAALNNTEDESEHKVTLDRKTSGTESSQKDSKINNKAVKPEQIQKNNNAQGTIQKKIENAKTNQVTSQSNGEIAKDIPGNEEYKKSSDNSNGQNSNHEVHVEQAVKDQTVKKQAAKEQTAQEQTAQEQAAKQQAIKEQAAKVHAVKEQAAKKQAMQEQSAKEQAAKEQAVKEQAVEEQAAREQAAKKLASKKKAAKELTSTEQASKEQDSNKQRNSDDKNKLLHDEL